MESAHPQAAPGARLNYFKSACRGKLAMPTSFNCNDVAPIEITTEVSRIDLDRVHNWLARKSYWAGEMPREVFDRAVRASLCFAALEGEATVGFSRVISDRATFAYVSDVFVDQERRGIGIGKRILAAIAAHPQLQDLRLWLLATADAHGLYARHGFTALAAPQRYMERRDAEVYRRMANAQAPGPSAA
jgi:GNAT superfamily N-acetyltransferase